MTNLINISTSSLIKLSLRRLLLSSLLLIASSLALALPDDANQPISIVADSAIKDDKLGLTIYEGNVSITQGSLNILADKVTVFIVAEQVSKMVAIGKPASFKQQPNVDAKDVIAKADTIDYFILDKKITLTENALLNQGGSTLTGKVINYDLDDAKAKAEGGVQVVMQPVKSAPVKTDPTESSTIDTDTTDNKKKGAQ
ncbi:MAG: lipopolysaccharide export system protein LptA [Marinobacter psychrophilus]|jgi:lipopolysaccharide export system protein LptA